jgi:hypothetical protein
MVVAFTSPSLWLIVPFQLASSLQQQGNLDFGTEHDLVTWKLMRANR